MLLCSLFLSLTLPSTGWAIPEKPAETFAQRYAATVVPFFKVGVTGQFIGTGGITLRYRNFIHHNPKGTIILLSGRAESVGTNAELIYDLYQQGYSVLAYDHRGQGASDRLGTRNPRVGYVDQFENYVADIDAFMNQIVDPLHLAGDLFLYGHSMAGAMSTFYVSQHPTRFAGLILSAPMFAIRPPLRLSDGLFATYIKIAIEMGLAKKYAFTQLNRNRREYPKNQTTSPLRNQQYWNWNEEISPSEAIAGASNGWVKEAWKATQHIQSGRDLSGHPLVITTPTLLLQATDDPMVRPEAQDRFCQAMGCVDVVRVPGKHAIFLGPDSVRKPAFTAMVHFLADQNGCRSAFRKN